MIGFTCLALKSTCVVSGIGVVLQGKFSRRSREELCYFASFPLLPWRTTLYSSSEGGCIASSSPPTGGRSVVVECGAATDEAREFHNVKGND